MKRLLLSIALLLFGLIAIAQLAPPEAQAQTGCTLATAKRDLQDYYGANVTGANQVLGGFYMNQVKIRNTSKNCTYPVGVGSYKAYEFYTISVKTQEYFAHEQVNLAPGRTWETTIKIPDCNYQVDVYYGNVLWDFKTTTYSGEGRLLDAWFFPGDQAQRDTNRPYCTKPVIVPSIVQGKCEAGTTWSDKNKNGKVDSGECLKETTTVCPTGSTWSDKNGNKKVDDGECLKGTTTIVTPTCPVGSVWVDKNKNNKVDASECEKPITSTCPSGTVWIDRNSNQKVDTGECEIPAKAVCPPGTLWVDLNKNKKVDSDECQQPITSTCPEGSIWVDKNDNKKVDANECEKPILTVCPSGSLWIDENKDGVVNEGECQKPVIPTCPEGTVWVDKNNNKQADEGECQVPVPSTTPTPTVLGQIEELPSTGPGAAVVISMFGLVGGLLARKHHMFDRFTKPQSAKPDKYNHHS